MEDAESAVVVLVPGADPVVEAFRAQLDPSATGGVPAHVTVLYPFLPSSAIGPAELGRLRAAVASVPRFEAVFDRIAWFDDEAVWLAPRPAAPFRALTAAVTAAFPGYRPYRGAWGDEPVPHLTIGADAPVDRLRAAADAVAPLLPVVSAVRTCHLLQGGDEHEAWHRVAELPLG